MRSLRAIAFLLLIAALPACATTVTSESSWEATPEPEWVRYGTVTQVREVVQRTEGNPGGGAVAGAVIGGLLTGRLFGAAAGAGIGAAASSGSAERRSYQVWVRFQDGGYQAFWYANYSPFRPGDPVALTPKGLYKS